MTFLLRSISVMFRKSREDGFLSVFPRVPDDFRKYKSYQSFFYRSARLTVPFSNNCTRYRYSIFHKERGKGHHLLRTRVERDETWRRCWVCREIFPGSVSRVRSILLTISNIQVKSSKCTQCGSNETHKRKYTVQQTRSRESGNAALLRYGATTCPSYPCVQEFSMRSIIVKVIYNVNATKHAG